MRRNDVSKLVVFATSPPLESYACSEAPTNIAVVKVLVMLHVLGFLFHCTSQLRVALLAFLLSD
jgi:hypothetical protein